MAEVAFLCHSSAAISCVLGFVGTVRVVVRVVGSDGGKS